MPTIQIRVLETYRVVDWVYKQREQAGAVYRLDWFGSVERVKEDNCKDVVREWRIQVSGENVGVLSPNKVYKGIEEVSRELRMRKVIEVPNILITDQYAVKRVEGARGIIQQGKLRVSYGMESSWLTLRADKSEEYYGNYIIYKQMRYYMQPDMMRVDVLKTQRYYSKHKQEVNKLNMKEKVVI